MKKKELMELLDKYSDDTNIMIFDDDEGALMDIYGEATEQDDFVFLSAVHH